MAQGESFKHITVTAPEEDDVVIMAGASAPASHECAEASEDVGMVETSAARPERVDAPDDAGMVEKSGRGALCAPAERSEAAFQSPVTPSAPEKRSQPARAKDAYAEPTLQDLEDAPMPLAQRIVIIAAVVCIIGAVIYYFAFMG